jgi:hypothetical protein
MRPSITARSLSIAALATTLSLAAAGPASAQGTAGGSATAATAGASQAAPSGATRKAMKRRALRPRVNSANKPTDGRTGGTPTTSARTPGGPPDDVNTGLTIPIPSIGKGSK